MKSSDKQNEIDELIAKLRARAAPVGPMHGFWDVIFDLECFRDGKPTILKKSHDEWMAYGRELLSR